MDFAYQATGGLRIFGTSPAVLLRYRHSRYVVGDLAFSRHAAERHGLVIPLYIKQVRHVARVIRYIDTMNALWTDLELCDYNDAVALVRARRVLINSLAEDALGAGGVH